MKNKIKIASTIAAFTIVAGLSVFAQQTPIISSNIGFIDEAAVIKNHPQVKVLEENQKKATLELQKFAVDARYQIISEKIDENKKKLEETLTNQLNDKKKTMDTEYSKQILSIQKDIISTVKTIAQRKNIALVFKRDSIIYGGTDLTQDVIFSFNKK